MSMPERGRIGFDRTISSEWMDAAAARVMTGEAPDDTRKFLWGFLEGIESGTTNNSNRGKTLTVLTRIWVSVPKQAEPLKRAALKCVASTPGEARIGLHWAMVVGTHPFFFDVANHVGKLIKLHGHASRSQIKRRMTDKWGDRSTLERAIQHVLRSMTQWGVLMVGREHGSLTASPHRIEVDKEVGQVLVHSVLLSHGEGLAISHLIDHPALFPFSIRVTARDLRESAAFRVQRQGDQSDFVELS
jgi:hypothetical protein